MWLLTFSIILFFVVIGLIIYANWPASPGSGCGGQCGGGCSSCQRRTCNRCYKPRGQCGCGGGGGGCPFC
jgi:hypothetical protein